MFLFSQIKLCNRNFVKLTLLVQPPFATKCCDRSQSQHFLFSLYIYFSSSSFTVLFPTYLYKNSFSRKILPEKSLLFYKTKTYCFYLYVKFKVHISRRFFNVLLFSQNFLARSRQTLIAVTVMIMLMRIFRSVSFSVN